MKKSVDETTYKTLEDDSGETHTELGNEYLRKIKQALTQLSSATMNNLIDNDPDYKAASQAVDEAEKECKKLLKKDSKEWKVMNDYYDGLCQMCLETGDLSYLAGIVDSYKVLEGFHLLMKNTEAEDARSLFQYLMNSEPTENDLMAGFRLGIYFDKHLIENTSK